MGDGAEAAGLTVSNPWPGVNICELTVRHVEAKPIYTKYLKNRGHPDLFQTIQYAEQKQGGTSITTMRTIQNMRAHDKLLVHTAFAWQTTNPFERYLPLTYKSFTQVC